MVKHITNPINNVWIDKSSYLLISEFESLGDSNSKWKQKDTVEKLVYKNINLNVNKTNRYKLKVLGRLTYTSWEAIENYHY